MARELEDVVRDFETQSEKLKKGAGGGVGPLASRNGLENRYGELYQELVARGAKPQIRGKYRGY